MKPAKGFLNSLGGLFSALMVLLVPVLAGYLFYIQYTTPTLDLYLDSPGSSTVNSTVRGGKADLAGVQSGDVILAVDDVQFGRWNTPQLRRTHAVLIERHGEKLTLAVPAVHLLQMNFLSLISSLVISLTYWGIGTYLLIRRFQSQEIRLLFLIFQAVTAAVMFPLAFQSPWTPPELGAQFSKAGILWLPPLFLHLSLIYPVKFGSPRQRQVGLLLIYSAIPLIFWAWITNEKIGVHLAILFAGVILALAAVFFAYGYRYRADSAGRRWSRVFIFCIAVSTILPVLLYSLPKGLGSDLYLPEWAAALFLAAAPIGFLFAAIFYNLHGIDRLINRTLVYAVLSLGMVVIYLVPYFLVYQFLPDDLFTRLAVIFALTVWIGWTFNWLRTRAQIFVDNLVFGGWYDFPVVVETISGALARSNTRVRISEILEDQVPKMMRLSNSNLWIGDPRAAFHPPQLENASFRYKFQTEIPAQWTIETHPDGDDLSEEDRRILQTLARQAEIALKNAFTIETLQNQLDEIRSSREILSRTQRQLLRSREEERSRLARDLHDSPIQSLVGMNIQIGLLLSQVEAGIPLADSLSEMRAEVRQLSDELRHVCEDLRPPMLDTLGLSSAIRSLASEWEAQNDVAVRLDLCPDARLKDLPGEVTVNFYRVAQEALTNIAKHAKAEIVKLSLEYEKGLLLMEIEDDGRGFAQPDTLHSLTAESHFGLAGMRERVDLIGGEWLLRSAPGEGTKVTVSYHTDGDVK